MTALAVERPRTAWLDGVNPVTKVAMVLVLAVPLLVSIDAVSAGTALILELLCVPLTGVAYGTVLRRLVPVIVFAPVAAVSMLLYARPGGTVYGTFPFATVSDDSIALSLAVLVRVVALAMPIILLFARTDPTELADALMKLTTLADPPLRFPAGADAVETFEQTAAALLASADAHRDLSRNLAHEDHS